jgi:hypothetical protein
MTRRLVAKLARTYGRLPSEIMRLSPYDLSITMLCFIEEQGELQSRLGGEGMAFPVVDMRDL